VSNEENVEIIPNWERTLMFMCHGQAMNDFNKGAFDVMASVLETTRFLAMTDPDALKRVIEQLKKKGGV